MRRIKPPALPDGGTIAVVAPSSPPQIRSEIEQATDYFTKLGYTVVFGPHHREVHGYLAGMDEHRAADLQWALTEPGIDMVHMLGGGYGAARLYPRIDWDALGDPRIVCGFSDITAIHLALAKHGPWTTFYGPNFSRFTRRKDELTDETKEWFHRAFTPAPLGRVFEDPENPYVLTIGGGSAEAPIVGGCMTLLCHSIGTPYEIDTDGCILMIEDLNEEPYMVDAGLHHLIRAGKFEGVQGFVFGTDVNLKENTIPELRRLEPVDRGDPRRADRAARDPRDRQRAGRPRQAHGDDPARRAGAARRRRQDARDRRARGVVNAAIDRDFDDHLERVRDFLRIPSVSAYDGDLRSTAAAVCELIEAAGGSAEIAEPGERRPTVIGVIDGPGPTVLRYGMYDVQPPGAGWTRDPFAAEVDDGRIYARGAANSKAALAGSLLAFAGADSPCRQVLLMDGEEELGSPRLGRVLRRAPRRAARRLGARLRHARGRGRLGAGGGRLQGPARARAAGRRRRRRALVADRLACRSPASDLARAMIALQDAIPAANVTWMIAGTPEDTSRTVVPGSARAGIDLRFDSGGDELLERVRALIPPEVELVVKGTYPAATSPLDAPPVQAMARVMERLGTTPQVAAQAPWWGPYHLYGAPFASGGPGPLGRRARPRRVVRGRRAAALHAHGLRHGGGAGQTHETALRGAHLAGAARARQARRPRRRHPHRDARGPRLPPADRHRLAARERDLRARGRGERRAGAAVPDPGPRLHAAPPRLPRQRHAALERVRRGAASTRAARSATTASTAS